MGTGIISEDLLVWVVVGWAFLLQVRNPISQWRPTKSIRLLQLKKGWISSRSFVPQERNTGAHSQLLPQCTEWSLLPIVAWPGSDTIFSAREQCSFNQHGRQLPLSEQERSPSISQSQQSWLFETVLDLANQGGPGEAAPIPRKLHRVHPQSRHSAAFGNIKAGV